MEFQEFYKAQKRMCESSDKSSCIKCPLYCANFSCPGIFKEDELADIEQIVEQWAKEHPLVTNGDKLKEVFGNCMRVDDSAIYPLEYYGRIDKWLKQEYQPPKGEEG